MQQPMIHKHVLVGCGPLSVTVVNEGLKGSPTENVIILGGTVIGRGPDPMY